MRVIADTNVLLRASLCDDAQQAQAAEKVLRDATLIVLPLVCLCEYVWVLRTAYDLERSDVHSNLTSLLAAPNVVFDQAAVEAGLAVLESGGDFADGVIAFEGRKMGGENFVSFDKRAVKLLEAQGMSAMLLR